MASPRLHLVAATPGGASLQAVLRSKRGSGTLIVTAFSPGRLRAAKEIVGDDPEVDFVEFGGLVGQFLALAGEAAGGLPGRGHIEAAVALGCQVLPESSIFHPVSHTGGFQALVTRKLDQLRGYGLESAQLKALSQEAEGELANKLEGLALIQAEAAHSLDLLGKHFNSARIRECIDLPTDMPFEAKIILLAGTSDDPTNLSWIPWAVQAGIDLTVLVDTHPTDDGMFEGAKNIAHALGVEPSYLLKVNSLTSQLFSKGTYDGAVQPLEVEVHAMPDPLAECEWALRIALQEIESGTPQEKIAIVVRRMDEYAPSLEASAVRLGVTLSVTRTMPLLAAGLPKFLLELLESLVEKEPTRLVHLLRSSYLGIPADDLAALSDLFREVRVDKADSWKTLADGLLARKDLIPWAGQLFRWRAEALGEPTTLAGWAERLRELGELPWLQRTFEGAEPTAVRDRYAMNVLQRCIAEMAAVQRVRDDHAMNLSGFKNRCRDRWEQEEVAIPRAEDGVAVVSSAESIGDAEVVMVLGMLEGVFPRRRSEDPILTDKELAWISSKIGHILPDSHRRAREERDEFFRVCSSASRRLILSYPQSGEDKDNVLAFYLAEVQELTKATTKAHSRKQWVPEQPISAADLRLKAALEGDREEPLANELRTDEASDFVRRQAGDRYTLRDLQTVLECPFRYVASGKLQLRSFRPQSRWNHLLGLPEKVNLPSTPNRETALRRLNEELDSLLSELYGEATPEDLVVMRLGGQRLIAEWVDREFYAREIWKRAAAQPDPKFDEELRSRFKTRDNQEVDLKGKFAGLSYHGSHRVLNLFVAHEPYQQRQAPTLLERLRDSDRFAFGMALAAIRDPKQGVGLEIDTGKGERRLILSPRPMPPPAVAKNLSVETIDEDERREWIDFVESQCRTALARLNKPSVDAQAGDYCKYCDMGELCRRSKAFSELGDPFEDGGEEQ